MNEQKINCLVLLVILFAIWAPAVFSQETATTPIWKAIRDEARQLAQPEVIKKRAEYWKAAERIASQFDQAAVTTILLGQLRDFSNLKSDEWEKHVVSELSQFVVAEIVDSDDRFEIRPALKRWGGQREEAGLVSVAALASVGDPKSQRTLLRLALRQGEFEFLKTREEQIFFSAIAVQFLRCQVISEQDYQALKRDLVRADSEQTLNGEVRSHFVKSRLSYLRSALAMVEKANRIHNPDDKKAFLDFQLRLWRAYVVAPKRLANASGAQIVAARILESQWQPDDRFLLQALFADPASTQEELEIAVVLGHRVADPSYLKKIANSPAPHTYYAQAAFRQYQEQERRRRRLERRQQEQERLRRRLERRQQELGDSGRGGLGKENDK